MQKKQRRILVVSQHYWPENFRITDICAGFKERGIDVQVLCGLPNYPKGEWFDGYNYFGPRSEEHEGIKITRCGEIRRKGNTNLRIFLNYVSFPFFALFNLPRLIGKKFDAVLCYNTSPVIMAFPAIVYAKINKVPLTTYVLDLWPENLYSTLDIQNKFLRKVAKSVSHYHYRCSNKLIGLSQEAKEILQKIAPRAKCCEIPQHCEDLYFEKRRDDVLVNRFKSRFTVVFTGNISPAQNLNLLLLCAARLKEQNKNNIHFVIVGDGMSRKELEDEIKAQNLCDFFTFEGIKPVEDMPLYYDAADAMFLAYSNTAGLDMTIPAKLSGYLASGKPVLAAVGGAGANAIIQSGAGLVSSCDDVDKLYENLLCLADKSGEELLQMGEGGTKFCKKHLKRDVIIDKLTDFIFDTN